MTETILPTDPLSAPSHSAEHNQLTTQVVSLTAKVTALEAAIPTTAENISQARLAAHEWVVPDQVQSGVNLLLPVLWNLTGRVVEYEAAKATVFAAPQGQSILIDIVTGTTVGGGEYDIGTMTSILAAPLEIPAGQFVSTTYTDDAGDFLTDMPIGSFVAAYVLQAGVDPDTGAGLTIQLNRLL